MKAWAVVAHNAPLECVEMPDPEPVGTEIVVEVTHCGVCHSDLHLWKGGYDLGGGRMLSVKDRGLVLPAAPGHEIVGRVARLGPDASGVAVGNLRLVYPWVGCGHCAHCRAEEDNHCNGQRSLGVTVNGGFGGLVKVPHSRYLIPFDGVDPALAATYACSGLTAYAAIQKVMPLEPDETVALIGTGGLGLAAVAVLRALGHAAILVVDPSADRRGAALKMGASIAVDGTGSDVAARILATAQPRAVLDFVGSDATAGTAMAVLPKGGRLVLVGIGGGELTLSVAGTIFRAQTVQGSLTGTIAELRAVIALARAGKLAPIPVRTLPKDQANAAMDALENGRVTGRLVLVENRS